MIEIVEVKQGIRLADYAANANLSAAVSQMEEEARAQVPALGGRRIWMLSSTAKGGGVAEMMPKLVGLLSQLGADIRWVVIKTPRTEFFKLTKRLHNLIHGAGDPRLTARDREVFESVSRGLADELAALLAPSDILVVHDPQPLAVGALVAKRLGLAAIWRCHIGLDRTTPETRAAWEFLEPWFQHYRRTVFSVEEYIPARLADAATVINPAIDPLSHKNRDLSAIKLTGVLCNAGLMIEGAPVLTPDWPHQAQRLGADGVFAPARNGTDIGLLFRPTVTQVSRWDRLKGWAPLLRAFEQLKRDPGGHERERRRVEILRLVLAGPEQAAVSDDPEAEAVLDELVTLYRALPRKLQDDVAILLLPMRSQKFNALMVNALQRSASVIVQNSIQEGFGLVATEAMWKRVAVVGSNACGLRKQLSDGVEGRLVRDPNDPICVAQVLRDVLKDPHQRAAYARNAQRRVHDDFLVFRQIRSWLQLLASREAITPSTAFPSS